jgi:leader peptidase (prepilin peptidase)/N-methyltransferase
VAAVTALLAAVAAAAGLVAGPSAGRLARRYPWSPGRRAGELAGRRPAVGSAAVLAVGTALLLALTVARFGPSWQLPAFLVLAVVGLLLALLDLRHQVLPNRVLLPALVAGGLLLTVAAAAGGAWPALLRAVLGAAVLFLVFLALALISPAGLGMGDVKLAALLGLYLGWLGWNAVLWGGVAGFAVQGVVALVLLATRRIDRRAALPFGPAMLVGAGLVLAWPLS